MKHLTVILGAGFSANANLPTAKYITKRFNRNLKDKLIKASSGEWFWVDNKNETDLHNGRLNYDYLAYSYIFNELVKTYISEKDSFINYEDFYQYILDNNTNEKWIEEIFNKAKTELINDFPEFKEKNDYLFPIDNKQYFIILDILNYLIADILRPIPKKDDELKIIYKNFIELLNNFDVVDIFTLNHDTLLEYILDLHKIAYSKGFNTKNSPIIYKKEPVPFFDNIFEEKIKIHKLHGSLDFYEYRYYKKNGTFWQATDKSVYYMTNNYYTIHEAKLIDTKTNEIIQGYNFNIVPKFITGTNKEQIIKNERLFRELYNNYGKIIEKTQKIFISGYSFSDNHINEKLKEKQFKFINHNPSNNYPFSSNGINIKHLNELKTVANILYSQ